MHCLCLVNRTKLEKQCQFLSNVFVISSQQWVRHRTVTYTAWPLSLQKTKVLILWHYIAGCCHSHSHTTTSALLWCQMLTHRAWVKRSSFSGCLTGMWGQDGWYCIWPSSIIFCMFMDQDEVKVHKLAEKKIKPIFSHLDRTILARREFSKFLWGKLFLWDTAGNQSQHRIWLILPAHGASHIIRKFTLYVATPLFLFYNINRVCSVDN